MAEHGRLQESALTSFVNLTMKESEDGHFGCQNNELRYQNA